MCVNATMVIVLSLCPVTGMLNTTRLIGGFFILNANKYSCIFDCSKCIIILESKLFYFLDSNVTEKLLEMRG